MRTQRLAARVALSIALASACHGTGGSSRTPSSDTSSRPRELAPHWHVDGTGSEQIVTDARSNLTWTRCVLGQSWAHNACERLGQYGSHANAARDCEALVRAGHDDWRLPTADELRTLRMQTDPPYDTAAFPGRQAVQLWTSSEAVHDHDRVLYTVVSFRAANFAAEESLPDDAAVAQWTRCVRGSVTHPDRVASMAGL